MAPSSASSSVQASSTLRDAFERFALSVSQDDQLLFHNTQLKDVWDEALQIEKKLRKKGIQRNIARLNPLLRGMEHYSKVVEVLCNGTPYLSWIWAPIKLMLMVTHDSLSALEKLIEAYGKIADMLPRLDRLSNALTDDHNFQNVLALVCSDIVEFHRRAYKFVRRKSWTIFFSSMWAGFETRFNEILKNLAYHGELVDKEAAAADIAEAFRRSKADDKKWEQQEREWNTAKVQKVLGWLETNDTLPADILEQQLQDYLPNSCDWFVQHEATQIWLEDDAKNPFLWLYGKPGAEESSVNVFYYFCSSLRINADGQIRRPNRILRSIISQVIQKHQDLAIYVHDVYFIAHPVPTKKALMSLLTELLRGMGSVRLIIDGIDEWVSQDQRDVLNDLSQIVSTDKSSHLCKILVASRETFEISRSLLKRNKSTTTISLSNDDEGSAISQSITNFVESKLSDLPDHFDELDPDASIMPYVKKTLIEKSHGMFLWVSLVLDLLDRVYSPEELRTIVDDLPSDLEKLYEKLFTRLCSAPGAHSHGGVSRIMGLICSARRPLHKSELLQALSISPHDNGSRTQSIPVASILDHCKPLIEELLDSTIVPVHFSVKEYFFKSHKPQIMPAIDSALDILSACAVVITRSLDLVYLDSSSVDYLARIASGHHRLLPYALEFWVEHCLDYASSGGNLSPDGQFQYHLSRIHEKHEECLDALGRATVQVGTQRTAGAGDVDERLDLFSSMPIHKLMADVQNLRLLASQSDGNDRSDIETYVDNNDRTLFSRLSRDYESAIVRLLAQRELEGISLPILRAFQESYASTAFRCRYPHCDRLSLGFATTETRQEHENTHMQRVYCQKLFCQWSRIGFKNKAAFKTHTRKDHGESKIVLIPEELQRTREKSPPPIHDPLKALASPGPWPGAAMSTTSSPSKPWSPSFWTLEEKGMFQENVRIYGTKWTKIADNIGTKTPEMVQRYYDQLVQGGNRKLEKVNSPMYETHVKHTLILFMTF
ncbi:unnamed protein product [Alternaria alternata]